MSEFLKENVSVEKNWYVLRAVGGKEKKVKEYIENEINRLKLSDYISQVLIPTEKVFIVRNGKKVPKERIFLPGYVIVEASLTGEIPHILKNVPNVISFLSETKNGDPVPLRKSEVNRLLGKVDELAESAEAISIPFQVGENVNVTEGPFNGFTGTVEEVLEEKRKLKVMVKIFGRKTLVELSFMQVGKE